MTKSSTRRAATQLDVKEIVHLVDGASGNFAFAVDCFGQIGALFESIAAALPEHGLAHRLAKLGEDLCEDREGIFERHRDEYSQHAERYVLEIRGPDASTSVADLDRLNRSLERESAQGERHAN